MLLLTRARRIQFLSFACLAALAGCAETNAFVERVQREVEAQRIARAANMPPDSTTRMDAPRDVTRDVGLASPIPLLYGAVGQSEDGTVGFTPMVVFDREGQYGDVPHERRARAAWIASALPLRLPLHVVVGGAGVGMATLQTLVDEMPPDEDGGCSYPPSATLRLASGTRLGPGGGVAYASPTPVRALSRPATTAEARALLQAVRQRVSRATPSEYDAAVAFDTPGGTFVAGSFATRVYGATDAVLAALRPGGRAEILRWVSPAMMEEPQPDDVDVGFSSDDLFDFDRDGVPEWVVTTMYSEASGTQVHTSSGGSWRQVFDGFWGGC